MCTKLAVNPFSVQDSNIPDQECTNFPKSRNQNKIQGATWVTWSKFRASVKPRTLYVRPQFNLQLTETYASRLFAAGELMKVANLSQVRHINSMKWKIRSIAFSLFLLYMHLLYLPFVLHVQIRIFFYTYKIGDLHK